MCVGHSIVPYLVHEVGVRFEDVRTLASEGRSGGGSSVPGAGTVVAVRETVRLTGALGWDYVAGASRPLLASDAGAAWTAGRAASILAAVLLTAGLVTSALRVRRGVRRVEAWPLKIDTETLYNLEDNLLLFFTGYSRSASNLLSDQQTKSQSNDAEMIKNLHFVVELGREIKKVLVAGDNQEFAVGAVEALWHPIFSNCSFAPAQSSADAGR